MPLKYRVRGAEHIALYVVGLRADEGAEVIDAGADCDEASIVASHRACALISACVYLDGDRAFPTPKHAKQLFEPELVELHQEVVEAISRISPLYALIDYRAWVDALKTGASHPSNRAMAFRVAQCVDVVGGFTKAYKHPRPDRWYGVPISELTDGQLLAYDAACALYERG